MQNTYRISKAAPLLSYLPRFIKIVRADSERSANTPKKFPHKLPIVPLITQAHDPEKLDLDPSLLSYPQFRLNPACTFVSSNRH